MKIKGIFILVLALVLSVACSPSVPSEVGVEAGTPSVLSITLKCDGVEIEDNALTVSLSQGKLSLTATVVVENSASKDYILESDNSAIASVSNKEIVLHSTGTTFITAKAVGNQAKKHTIVLTVVGESVVVAGIQAPESINITLGERVFALENVVATSSTGENITHQIVITSPLLEIEDGVFMPVEAGTYVVSYSVAGFSAQTIVVVTE